MLQLQVRRFYCHHHAYGRRTFVESLSRFLQLRARPIHRLARTQARVGFVLDREVGARLAGQLAMATSPDTVMHFLHGTELPPTGPLRAVGIDDWAIRKRQSYGRLIVDLDRRRPIDLRSDRSSTTVAGWMRRHPGIAVITRNPSSEYARAATMGAPAAL